MESPSTAPRDFDLPNLRDRDFPHLLKLLLVDSAIRGRGFFDRLLLVCDSTCWKNASNSYAVFVQNEGCTLIAHPIDAVGKVPGCLCHADRDASHKIRLSDFGNPII
jgi:hypothetical protein